MKPQLPLGCEDFSKTCNAAIRLKTLSRAV